MKLLPIIFLLLYVAIFIAIMRHNKSGKKRGPVNQIMRFRGNEVHAEKWRSAYDRLPIEMQIEGAMSYEQYETLDGKNNNYQEAFDYEY